jgi:Fe-S cluster biogenesis protein NfuA
MPSEIQIEVDEVREDSDTCVLRVDRTVSRTPEYYSTVEEAAPSPLGRRLLGIGGLEAVLLQDRTVTLLKPVPGEPWDSITAAAVSIITDHFGELDRIRAAANREMTAEERELFFEVQNLLNEEINPMVASHGGYIEVIDVKENDLYVSMGGGCQGCGMAAVTLRQGVEQLIRQHMPVVRNIFDATDHAAGENPYYSAER